MGRDVTLWGYVAIVVAAVSWDTFCRLRSSWTIGRLMGWLLANRAVRAVVTIGWAWLGWHLFVRGTASFLSR